MELTIPAAYASGALLLTLTYVKVKRRLELSSAKHRSLTGHARLAHHFSGEQRPPVAAADDAAQLGLFKSEALELPSGTIASRISRCLARLRELLEGRNQPDSPSSPR